MSHGWFGIGIIGCKSSVNRGTLWRSAYAFDAAYLFMIAPRFQRHLHRRQASDTCDAKRHMPYFIYETPDLFFAARPWDTAIVAIEFDGNAKALNEFVHPKQAVYLLGAEDTGIPHEVLDRCTSLVSIPTRVCLNVATAGSLAMYDRYTKQCNKEREGH